MQLLSRNNLIMSEESVDNAIPTYYVTGCSLLLLSSASVRHFFLKTKSRTKNNDIF